MKRFFTLILFCVSAICTAQNIRIQSPELEKKYYSTSSFDVSYTCQNCPVNMTVQVYVNGQLQAAPGTKGVRPKNQRFTVSGLKIGDQKPVSLRIVFLDEAGNILQNLNYQLQYLSHQKRLYFLGVGVGGRLDDSTWDILSWPANDISKVAECVQKNYSSHYSNGTFGACITNPRTSKGTRGDILYEFQHLQGSLVRDDKDVVMLYFSGHGKIGPDGEWYFVTKDAQSTRLTSTALSGALLREHVASLAKSARVYLFIDACNSAALYRNPSWLPANVVFYASSKADESSFENQEASSFSQAFCKAFQPGGAANTAGEITVRGLFDYINKTVGQDLGYKQHPALMPTERYENDVLFKVDTTPVSLASSPIYAPVRGVKPALMSIIPGGGQLYKQDYLKAGLFFGGTLLAGGSIVFCESQRKTAMAQISQTHDVNNVKALNAKAQNFAIARNASIVVAAALYIYNIADAGFAYGHKRVQVTPAGVVYNF